MNTDIKLLARAGEEIAVLLELTTGYPDNPAELLRANPDGATLIIEIFARLVQAGQRVPTPVANLVHHISAPSGEHA